MEYLRNVFKVNSKDKTPSLNKRADLTSDEVFNTERNHFTIKGLPSPTNQQIADILGRTIEEVNVFRPLGPPLHTYYDGDDGKPLYKDHERQKIIDNFMEETKALKTDGAIFKARNDERQRESTTQQQKINTGLRLPVNQDPNLRFVKPITYGGRSKTISNKNKKKHKKLSRRRSSKKNRKSIKRK
jgi:hypothetical protein